MALGAVMARAEGLDEAAEVYEALAGGTDPSTLPPHIGFWVADETVHNPFRAGAASAERGHGRRRMSALPEDVAS